MIKYSKHRYIAGLAGITVFMLLAGCQKQTGQTEAQTQETAEAAGREAQTRITGNGDTVSVEGAGAFADGGVVTISQAGTYRLSGAVNDGCIVVDAGKEDEVRLVLDGFSIASSDFSAIYGSRCGLLTIVLEEGTENAVEDGVEYVYAKEGEDEPDAAIFCKDALVLEGSGSLTISGRYQDGIRGKDDLTVKSGACVIQAVNDGIKGKDSVEVEAGELTITAGGDGIQSSNDMDSDKGYVKIVDGTINITAGKKGLSAETLIEIGGGSVTVDSQDDAVHSNGDVKIAAGVLNLSTGDDAVHADNHLEISGGDIQTVKSYEGLEGLSIDITGGNVTLNSDDDGINAAGGKDSSGNAGKWGDNPFETAEGAYIRISGGTVKVNASGDGIDSNGDLFIEGGVVLVEGPVDNGNGTLDYNGTGIITGGTFLGTGSAGMLQAFSEASTQPVLIVYYTEKQSAGTSVTVTDSAGTVLTDAAPAKDFETLVFSSADLERGKTYQVVTGETAIEISVDGILNQTGTPAERGGFGGGSGRGRGKGQMRDGQELPEGLDGQEPPDLMNGHPEGLDGQTPPAGAGGQGRPDSEGSQPPDGESGKESGGIIQKDGRSEKNESSAAPEGV